MTAPADRLSRIFHAAIARPPNERAAFVAEACGGDEELRQEIESLMAVDGAASGFLERPATDVLGTEPTAGRLVGQVWGAYTIVAPLGAGGMGEVYRAHDARLDRDVALKVLQSEVSADPERRERLAREAKLLAALSHPNIGAIYGLEERDGAMALVLELVEGPTLAQRLDEGPLSVREAQAIARQIAEALQAAHDKGLVHRDLKPANIVLQPSAGGPPHPKVLDFGLAKPLMGDAPSPAALTDTTEGRILGTPAYMSPEQARGLPVDRRTDIWAFGCVLFEMLSGLQPFEGATATDTLARILDHEPDWSILPLTTPDAVRRLLERCLRKEPHRRLHDIGDALIELEDATRQPLVHRVQAVLRSKPGRVLQLAAAAALVVAVVQWLRPAPAATESVVFTVAPAQGSVYAGLTPSFAVSPDGRHLAWVEQSKTSFIWRVWVRAFDSLDARPLPGTERAWGLFWRPDGRAIGFFAAGMLKTVSLDGDSPLTLDVGTVGDFPGGTWNTRDDVLFTSGCCVSHVKAVQPAPPPRQVTTKAEGERHLWPAFLPDGDHFLFFVLGEKTNEVRVGSLTSSETRSLGVFESHVAYLDGHVFYVRGGNLMAQAFDATTLRLEGDPWRLGVEAGLDSWTQRGMFSVGPTALAYRSVARPPTVLTWVNRNGKVLDTVGEPAPMVNVGLSADGSRIAVSRLTEQLQLPDQTDIWILDPAGGQVQRLTHDQGWDWDPAWSPDGSQIAFTSDRGHRFRRSLYVAPSNGTGEALLLDEAGTSGPNWSADGRYIIYNRLGPQGLDLWTIDMAGDRTPKPFLNTAFVEHQGRFSPDGRWVAYNSMVTGLIELYLRRFPAGTDAIRVSTDGGVQATWRGDGKELFFVARDGVLTAVDVDPVLGSVGQPRPLFPAMVRLNCCNQYAVSPDGQRFLMVRPLSSEPPITVVLNWKARLHR